MKHIIIAFFTCLIFTSIIFAQNEGVQIGSNLSARQTSAGGYYDYSDPQAVNIKVAIWGWVRYPGKYIIPAYSNVNDLLSYAGGPTDAAHMEHLKLIRTEKDSSETIIPIKYQDLLVENDIKSFPKAPPLMPGDVLVVSGEPRLYFNNYLSITLSVVSTLVSVATLLYLIVKK
ncbi:MAG: hypothetical protein M1480_00825 [Bacteroidetes bacterium]|nr:hypothetical protein [Bacteroidota bacterium]